MSSKHAATLVMMAEMAASAPGGRGLGCESSQ